MESSVYPSKFLCPLLNTLMDDPVCVKDNGRVYERRAIEQYFASCSHFYGPPDSFSHNKNFNNNNIYQNFDDKSIRDPISGEVISRYLIPCKSLQKQIRAYRNSKEEEKREFKEKISSNFSGKKILSKL